MKTISQIAKEEGVSRANIYRTLQVNNIKLADLSHEKRGNSTLYDDEAVNVIVSALHFVDTIPDTSRTLLDTIPDTSERLIKLEAENARLEEALKNKEEIITILKADKEHLEDALKLERQKREEESSVSQRKIEQLFLRLADVKAEKKLLEAENEKGFWKRIFSRKNKYQIER